MTAAAIEADLLPCPFCGGRPVVTVGGLAFCNGGGAGGFAHDEVLISITAWNTRQPTTPTTGEDDVDRIFRAVHTKVLNLEPAADHMRRNRKIDRKDALSAIEMFRRDVITSLAAISPTTEDAEKRELVEELLVAERDMAALPRDKKNEMESITGFSADACAQLFGTAAKALASIGERS